MQDAVRSYFTAGVALAGAGVIAVSPIAPTPADIHLPAVNASSASVALSALTNPLDAWAQTLAAAGANLQSLGEQLVANPAPILQTVVGNQIGNATVIANTLQAYGSALGKVGEDLPLALQEASELISQGKITEGVDGLTTTLLPAIVGLLDVSNNTWSTVSNTTQNIQNVVAALPSLVQSVALPSLFPVLSVLNGIAATAEEVVTAANAGDAEGVANALINAPANLTDAFLNGKGTILGFIDVPGLLSPTSPFGFLGSGPIASAIDIPGQIANLLKPNPLAPAKTAVTAAASAAPASALSAGTSARAVTLSLPAADTGKSVSAGEDTTNDAGAVADSATGSTVSADTGAAADATAGATADATTVTKPATSTKRTAKSVRDDIRTAAKRFGEKISGRGGNNATSTGTDSASSGSAGASSSASSASSPRGGHTSGKAGKAGSKTGGKGGGKRGSHE